MVARFFFDLVSDEEVIRDNVGVEAQDLNQALDVARSIITEMAEEIAETHPDGLWELVVRDDRGSIVGHLLIGG